jgi:hypothetical protein
MLKQGLLMVDYDKVKELNDFLKVLSNTCKQWTNNIGWKMAIRIHDYVLMYLIVQKVSLTYVSCNEVATNSNQHLINVDVYIMKG